VALGIALMAVCGLAAVLLAAGSRSRTPMLAVADGVGRGEIVERGDLRTVAVAADAPVAYLGDGEADQVVGRVALVDLPAGALVTADQFADPTRALAPGDGTVGLTLERGQLPAARLAPGDRVRVVAGSAGGGPGSVVAESAEVVVAEEIESTSGQPGTWWVSLRASEAEATRIAEATTGDAGVRLVLLAGQ
jgi:hypothetical protein